MKLGKRIRTVDDARRELREAESAIVAAQQVSPRDLSPAERLRVLAGMETAAGRAVELRREIETRDRSLQSAAREQAAGRETPTFPEASSPSQRNEWVRLREEQLARRREQKRQDELAAQEAARRRHAERVASGRALEPLWTRDPHLQACAILGSGRLWSWARGIGVEGESVRAPDGTLVDWETIRDREGGRIPQLIDGAELVVLWSVAHLISERGTDGVAIVNPRQERLWPIGLTDVKGSLRRLVELELIEIRGQTGDTLEIAWGPLALKELDRFVSSFTPPAKQRGRLARLVSPELAPELSASAEAEQALAAVRERVAAEAAGATGDG